MKANKIIEMSQEKSRQKVKLAMEEIQRMRNEGERITVSGLCKRRTPIGVLVGGKCLKKSKKKYIKLLIFKIKAIK